MIIGSSDNQQEAVSYDYYEATSGWQQDFVLTNNLDFPVTWIEIHAMTNKGDGLYKDFDKPVYVDDFTLEVTPP